uniref:Uncharacterized protein n=1 Tax=Arundo donax TaxID=35708 RepID=A0A0A9CFW1_ARUDO
MKSNMPIQCYASAKIGPVVVPSASAPQSNQDLLNYPMTSLSSISHCASELKARCLQFPRCSKELKR